ncbi:MAG TPA: S53 family peptidase [Acidimicrobiales bacterium]|nr:S53 family peptidase [Acidimicrobiales bacterium]
MAPGTSSSRPPSRRSVRRLAAGAVAALGAAAAMAAPAAHAAPATVQVGSGLAGLSQATNLGAAAASEVHTVGVALDNKTGEANAQDYYAQLYKPGSPLYHHFLTPSQYAKAFGEPAAVTDNTVSFLQSGGLQIVDVSSAGDWVLAQGTTSQLDQIFGVSINRYRIAGISFEANDRAPSVPANLPVAAVFGLDTYHRFQIPGGLTHTAVAAPTATSAGTFNGILTPQNLWGVYDQPATDLGDGQTMGIFGEGDTSSTVTNLRLFEQHFGFPKVPVNVVRTEGGSASDYGDNAGNIEWYLDSQASTGMAPHAAALDLYFAKSLYDADILNSFAYWAEDPNGPTQMNASFGECETSPANPVLGPLAQVPFGTEFGDELEPVGDKFLLQAAVEGRTLFSSTGDTGSGCPEVVVPVLGGGNGFIVQPVKEVSYPAASPYVVAVGGTVVTTNDPGRNQRSSEVSWTYTGGGSSYFIAEPNFQKGVAAVNEPCLSQPDGTPYATTTTCRGIPDVADMSGNVLGNGYSIYIDGTYSSEGGTSLSSPLMMGMWARIQAAAPHNTASSVQGLGFADETLYPAAAKNPKAFYDVTSAETPAGNGAYQPAAGWDYTSGLGVPDVAQLLRTIDARTTVASDAEQAPAAKIECTAAFTSPTGNSTDPVVNNPLGSYSTSNTGYDPALDLTAASLTTKGADVVATFSGPAVTAATNPATATGGRDLYLLWSSQDPKTHQWNEWFLQAHFDSTNSVQVTSGESTTSGPDQPYSYTPSSTTKATYSVKGDTMTVTAPLSEVGSPAPGTLLTNPYALAQEETGTPDASGSPSVYLGLVADTAALPTDATVSQGEAVKVAKVGAGGC